MAQTVEHLMPRDSWFARFDARWKLAALAIAAGVVAAMRSPVFLTIALAASLLLALVARVPGRWFRSRLGLLLFSLLPFLIILPLTVDRGPTFDHFGVRLHQEGFVAAGALIARAGTIVTLMLVLLSSAPLHVTLKAAHDVRVPSFLVLLTLLTYRYVFLLLDELNRLRIALRVRGYRNRTTMHSYRTISRVTGTLLVRGLDRAERVDQAMRCRGFDGRFRSLDEFRTTWRDVVLFVLIVAFYVGLVLAEYA